MSKILTLTQLADLLEENVKEFPFDYWEYSDKEYNRYRRSGNTSTELKKICKTLKYYDCDKEKFHPSLLYYATDLDEAFRYRAEDFGEALGRVCLSRQHYNFIDAWIKNFYYHKNKKEIKYCFEKIGYSLLYTEFSSIPVNCHIKPNDYEEKRHNENLLVFVKGCLRLLVYSNNWEKIDFTKSLEIASNEILKIRSKYYELHNNEMKNARNLPLYKDIYSPSSYETGYYVTESGTDHEKYIAGKGYTGGVFLGREKTGKYYTIAQQSEDFLKDYEYKATDEIRKKLREIAQKDVEIWVADWVKNNIKETI